MMLLLNRGIQQTLTFCYLNLQANVRNDVSAQAVSQIIMVFLFNYISKNGYKGGSNWMSFVQYSDIALS